MAFFKKVAALVSNTNRELQPIDPKIEEEMNTIFGKRIAESPEAILYGGIDDLNGYLFLEIVLVSPVNIKTFNGATLSFSGPTDFELKSDTQEIESEFSNVSNRFMTRISFDITQPEIKLIKEKQYEKVVFRCKKKSLTLVRSE